MLPDSSITTPNILQRLILQLGLERLRADGGLDLSNEENKNLFSDFNGFYLQTFNDLQSMGKIVLTCQSSGLVVEALFYHLYTSYNFSPPLIISSIVDDCRKKIDFYIKINNQKLAFNLKSGQLVSQQDGIKVPNIFIGDRVKDLAKKIFSTPPYENPINPFNPSDPMDNIHLEVGLDWVVECIHSIATHPDNLCGNCINSNLRQVILNAFSQAHPIFSPSVS